MVFKTFKSRSVRSSKTNTCRNNLFACRFARPRGHSSIRMRWLTSTKTLVMSRLFLRWRRRKGFQSVLKFQDTPRIFWETNRLCTTFTYFKTLRPRKRGFLHEAGFSLPHLYHFDSRSYSESKQPRFRLLEIEANAVIYFSNKPGFWRREPRLVTYVTEISLLQKKIDFLLAFWNCSFRHKVMLEKTHLSLKNELFLEPCNPGDLPVLFQSIHPKNYLLVRGNLERRKLVCLALIFEE